MTIGCVQSSKDGVLKSQSTFSLPSMWIVLIVCLLLTAPGVLAQSTVDFYCNVTNCTGTVVQSGSNFSSSGISVFNDGGPFPGGVPFTLAFNTATDTISLDGTGTDLGMNLIGKIISFVPMSSSGATGIGIIADWTTLPGSVQTRLGTTTATDTGFLIYMTSTGAAQSVDLFLTPRVSPIPEPASMFLVGTGLVAIGGLLRRRRTTRTETT